MGPATRSLAAMSFMLFMPMPTNTAQDFSSTHTCNLSGDFSRVQIWEQARAASPEKNSPAQYSLVAQSGMLIKERPIVDLESLLSKTRPNSTPHMQETGSYSSHTERFNIVGISDGKATYSPIPKADPEHYIDVTISGWGADRNPIGTCTYYGDILNLQRKPEPSVTG